MADPRFDQVVVLAVRGVRPMIIAEQLRLTPSQVYHQLQAARKRGLNIPMFDRGLIAGAKLGPRSVRLSPDMKLALRSHASNRGLTETELAQRILECVVRDDMVYAVLDDGVSDV